MPERILNKIKRSQLASYVGSVAALFQLAYLILIRPFVPLQILQLIIPAALVPIGLVIGRSLYFQRAHYMIRYDDRGFQIIKGGREVANHSWNEFEQTSIFADSSGSLNVRMYFERDGLYVDIPVSRAGGDPFELRSLVQNKLKR